MFSLVVDVLGQPEQALSLTSSWSSLNRLYYNWTYTYIIGHYNPWVRIIILVSHTTYVVCVNSIHKWRDLQFKIDSERKIFLRNFSWQFLFTLRVFARNLLLRGNRRWNTFCILFWCVAWGSNPGFTSNKPTHYILDILIMLIIICE